MPDAVFLNSTEVRAEDGRLMIVPRKVVSAEVAEQYRQGYRCMNCEAVQSQPFPEVCEEVYKDRPHPEPCMCGQCRCGYSIRDQQPADFAREFAGEESLWPHPEIDRERERFERRTGLRLPPGVRV